MVEEKLIEDIKKDFVNLIKKRNIQGILLYGSYIKGMQTNRSDIDICVVAPKEEPVNLVSYILQNIRSDNKKYDIRLFKELPLYIKIEIIQNGIVIYSPNKYELYEYFYIYRKLWNDQKHRQYVSKEELLNI